MRKCRFLSRSQKKQMHHSDNQIVANYYNLVFLTKKVVSIFADIRKISYLCI